MDKLSKQNIRLLIIDLDDTVWPGAPVINAAENALFAWMQRNTPRISDRHTLDSLRAHRQRTAACTPWLAHDLTAVRELSLAQLFQQFGYRKQLVAQAMAVFFDQRHRVQPFADVPAVLEDLRHDFTIAALTNGNADIRRTPLEPFFDFAITAAQAGVPKPEERIFRMVLDRFGVLPQNALHIGDDPLLDIASVQRLGMHTAWMNRYRDPWPAGLREPSIIGNDFYDVRDYLSNHPAN